MLSKYLIAPSVNSLFFTGILLLVIAIIFIQNFKKIKGLNYYQQLILLSTISIAIGIHGLIHLGVETVYNLNPYKWI
jgi:hypothetical protein